MDGKEMMNITVLIAGRPYPLKIKVGDEPTIRKIVKEVNDKVNQFQMTYTKKDKQDCLSMALLTYAVELQKLQSTPPTSTQPVHNEEAELSEKVNQLDELLDHLLQS